MSPEAPEAAMSERCPTCSAPLNVTHDETFAYCEECGGEFDRLTPVGLQMAIWGRRRKEAPFREVREAWAGLAAAVMQTPGHEGRCPHRGLDGRQVEEAAMSERRRITVAITEYNEPCRNCVATGGLCKPHRTTSSRRPRTTISEADTYMSMGRRWYNGPLPVHATPTGAPTP